MFRNRCIFENDRHRIFFLYLIHIREIEGATNNEQSRDTGNIGNTRYRTKTNKTQNTKNISNQTWGVNSSVRER
jgi:hypothetical protein